ncbi:hypothetical protein [Rhodanobacter umsongensis]
MPERGSVHWLGGTRACGGLGHGNAQGGCYDAGFTVTTAMP